MRCFVRVKVGMGKVEIDWRGGWGERSRAAVWRDREVRDMVE